MCSTVPYTIANPVIELFKIMTDKSYSDALYLSVLWFPPASWVCSSNSYIPKHPGNNQMQWQTPGFTHARGFMSYNYLSWVPVFPNSTIKT
jgi:hypothetical protein